MIDKTKLIEIRWHGRGGQGSVTSAELLAQAAISEGKFAQAFPSFGPERRGAPVLAFVRIHNTEPIRIRAGVTEPDVVVVLDPSLIAIANVTAGLKEGGVIVVNTTKSFDEIAAELKVKQSIAIIDATKIAREELGVPIVNTTLIGALIKATEVVNIDSVADPLKARFGRLGEKNINAMKRAYAETLVRE